MGASEARRADVISRLWAYAREHSLVVGRDFVFDETLRAIFGKKRASFCALNSLLSEHLRDAVHVAPKRSKKGAAAAEEEAAPAPAPVPPPLAPPAPGLLESALTASGIGSAYGKGTVNTLWVPPPKEKEKKPAKPKPARRPHDAPPAARNPYQLFMKEQRAAVSAEQPGLSFAEMSKALGQRWGTLGEAEKAVYRAAADADKGRASDDKKAYDAAQPKPGDPKKLKKTGLHVPMRLSPPLAAFLGLQPLPVPGGTGPPLFSLTRGAVTRRMWDYFKAHGLKDPANGQFYFADEKLRALFGQELGRFRGFDVERLLPPHYSKITDAAELAVAKAAAKVQQDLADAAKAAKEGRPWPPPKEADAAEEVEEEAAEEGEAGEEEEGAEEGE
jgi:chromatin remodeling complex protein RSC6